MSRKPVLGDAIKKYGDFGSKKGSNFMDVPYKAGSQTWMSGVVTNPGSPSRNSG